jgi:hypothetical protein
MYRARGVDFGFAAYQIKERPNAAMMACPTNQLSIVGWKIESEALSQKKSEAKSCMLLTSLRLRWGVT